MGIVSDAENTLALKRASLPICLGKEAQKH